MDKRFYKKIIVDFQTATIEDALFVEFDELRGLEVHLYNGGAAVNIAADDEVQLVTITDKQKVPLATVAAETEDNIAWIPLAPEQLRGTRIDLQIKMFSGGETIRSAKQRLVLNIAVDDMYHGDRKTLLELLQEAVKSAIESAESAEEDAGDIADKVQAAIDAAAAAEKCKTESCRCATNSGDSASASQRSADAAKSSKDEAARIQGEIETTKGQIDATAVQVSNDATSTGAAATAAAQSATKAAQSESNAADSASRAARSKTEATDKALEAARTKQEVEAIEEQIVTDEAARQQAESERKETERLRVAAETARQEAHDSQSARADQDHTRADQDHTQIQTMIENIEAMESGQLISKVSELETNKADKTWVNERLDLILEGAPEALNSFQELADALGNDPNFATTIMTELALKVSEEDFETFKTNLTATLNTRLEGKANKADVETALKNKVNSSTYTSFKRDTETALANKVDKEVGKGLSSNDFTSEEKEKLAGIAAGANKTELIDALTSTDAGKGLTAKQGKVLKDMIGDKSSAPDVANARNVWEGIQLAAQKGGTDDEELMNVLRAQMQKTLDRLQKI